MTDTRMPMAPMPLRLPSPTPMPSGPRSWSPCHSSVDTLLSPAPSHSHCSPTDPSLYKLHNYSNSNSRNIQAHQLQQPLSYNNYTNNNNNNNLPSPNAHQQQQQQWSQIKLSPVSAHPHPQQQQQQQQRKQMPLTSQLDYYRQLQIMHCQRERDIGQLYRQHQIFQQHHQVQQQQQQQQQQQDRPPSHAIQRGLLAQRMLQLQRLFQVQQIQRMQAMHKMGRAAVPAGASSASAPSPSPSPSSSASPSPSSFSSSSNGLLGTAVPESGSVQMSSESEQSRAEAGLAQQQPEENKKTKVHDPNTIHLPSTITPPSPSNKKTSSVSELAQIVLPSPDQIRKQRHQRLKLQARLRQAASAAAKTMAVSSSKATPKGTTADGVQGQSTMLMPVSPPASPSPYSTSTPDFSTPTPQQQHHSPSFAIATTNTMTVTTAAPLSPVTPTMSTPKESTFPSSHSPSVPLQLPANGGVQKVQPAIWTSSTTSLVARSKADLAYRRQLRLQLAIQQHLIQDHTHRYRLFQAFCLLQRAQAAQAMEEVQTQRERQLHTVAWVQALRQSQSLSQLEIPQ